MSRRFVILCFLLLASYLLRGQAALPSADDMALLRRAAVSDSAYADRQVRYGFTPGRRTLNPAYHALSSAMYLYQRFVSPVIMRQCAFSPTCSGYSKALLHEYGLLGGTVCTADRLMRCNRISLTDIRYHRLAAEGKGHIRESVHRYKL